MKALVYTATRRVEFRDEPEPEPGNEKVIVRVSACGICGSDMHGYHGEDPRRVPPLILGHEAIGVAETGRYAGRQVVVNPLMTCGECDACRSGRTNLCNSRELIGIRVPGAFAERVTILERNLLPLPAGLDPLAAALTEPAACAVHAVAKVAKCIFRPINEARALVLGGGAIGVLSAYVLRSHGCGEIALGDLSRVRRGTIDRLGIADTYDPGEGEPPAAGSYDIVIDAVGSGNTREAASRSVAPGGVVAHIGLQDSGPGFDTRRATLQEITFLGSYTYSVADFAATLQLLARGALAGDLSWVEQRALVEGPGAFADLDQAKTPACKIVLVP